MYINRYIEATIEEMTTHFKVLYVSGPRQVGKTTVLQRLAKQRGMDYVSLDDLRFRALAQKDPLLFLENHPPPLFIDEVQYAPDLFSSIKLIVDRSQKNGQYWITGSQHLALMKGLKESLAGRVGVIELLGLSHAEETGLKRHVKPFLPNVPAVLKKSSPRVTSASVFQRIFRGSFPAVITDRTMPLERFYGSYVQTYLDRDVRGFFGIEKMSLFQNFLGLVAARTGQILNISQLARDASVSVHAAKSWISILETSGLVYLLRPFFSNISKRLIKAPKLYMLDTGLASYLTRWPDAVTLQHGSMAGAMFETYVVSEIVKSSVFRGLEPSLFFFRTREGTEIDLLIQQGDKYSPIEVKMTAAPGVDDIRNVIKFEQEIPGRLLPGAVISLTDRSYPLSRTMNALPVSIIE